MTNSFSEDNAGTIEKSVTDGATEEQGKPGKKARITKGKQILREWLPKYQALMLPKFKRGEEGDVVLESKIHGESIDKITAEVLVSHATGAVDLNFANCLLYQVANTDVQNKSKFETALNSSAAALSGIHPKDELEGMLAAQMVASHNLAMAFSARAARGDNPDLISLNTNRAAKMMQMFVGGGLKLHHL